MNTETVEILEPEILSPLEELSSTSALIVKAEAKLTINSFDDKFIAKAEAALASLENKLETDDDFDKAKKDVEACKTTEGKLATALDDIISGNKEIAEVRDRIEKYISAFASKRKDLNKSVTARDKEKKEGIVAAGIKKVADMISVSPVKSHFNPDNVSITAAINNKKKYAFMEKAVEEAANTEIQRLSAMEAVYLTNTIAIDKARIDYPILFHDREALSLQDVKIVTLTIESRIAAHKLAEKERKEREEKAEQERKAREEREEAERKEREEAARLAKEEADRQTEANRQATEPAVQEQAPAAFVAPVFEAPAFTPPPVFDHKPEFTAPVFVMPDLEVELIDFRLKVRVRDNDIVFALNCIRALPEFISAEED